MNAAAGTFDKDDTSQHKRDFAAGKDSFSVDLTRLSTLTSFRHPKPAGYHTLGQFLLPPVPGHRPDQHNAAKSRAHGRRPSPKIRLAIMNPDEKHRDSLTLRQVVASVLAASFGVQSERNRQRDFSHGRPGQYILVGLVLTLIFVLGLWGLVRLVLSLSTS